MTFLRWLPTFIGFPLGGLLAIETVGSVHDPGAAAAAGLVAGTAIGAAQWLALRSRGIGPRWIAVTAAAMSAGATLAAALTGAGTELAEVMATGLITGAAVGAAQAGLLRSPAWAAVTAVAWSLGWLATWATIVDVDRGYVVFGSSGALVVTVLTGLVLRRVRVAPPLVAA